MAWVTSYLCIVTERNYPAMEVGGVWDIDAAMVVEEAIPQIRESRWMTFTVPAQLGRWIPPLAV